jgi:hypothetical protein
MRVRHRRHFHRLLQRRYLSDDRVITHMCAINISVATFQFSHCYLYSGMRKKNVGHYFLSNLRKFGNVNTVGFIWMSDSITQMHYYARHIRSFSSHYKVEIE